VSDKPPQKHSYLDSLEKQIKECFKVNCESPVGLIIKKYADDLLYVLGDSQEERKERIEPCELFCLLRAYFLNHLKTNPDQFNCNLFDEVSCLSCPRECNDEQRNRDRKEWEKLYREEQRESFRKLLYYVQRYQYDCVFGDLIFSCQQPCEANCLVLGTVEVLNGKLVRVCNTPRKYLWAPANLIQVLIYEIMTGGLTSGEGCEDRKVPCCPDYRNFDALYFLMEFRVSQCARGDAATSSIHAFREVSQSLHRSFDFTDSMAIPSSLFSKVRPDDQKMVEDWRAVEKLFGISSSVEEMQAVALSALTPSQSLQAHALLRRNDSVVAYRSEGETEKVLTDLVAEISPNRTLGRAIETIVKTSEQTAKKLDEMSAEIERLNKKVAGMEQSKNKK
jgi:hypothetical protein